MRELIPLFKSLPDEIYSNLDLSGFYLPTEEVKRLREKLEQKLGHFVVSYKADIFNLKVRADEHLCAIVKGADLDKKQIKLLREYEQKVSPFEVTFVVYQKPLQLMEIKSSALYKEYLKRGLL